MDKELLKRLIDSVYELEGLLELALRSETPVAGLREATKNKLVDILNSLNSVEKVEQVDEQIEEVKKVDEDEETWNAMSAAEVEGVEEKNEERGVPIILSVNDRFRYKRTLFNGNGARLQAALVAISVMKEEDDVRRFLAAESGLDAHNDPEIESFMQLLSAQH